MRTLFKITYIVLGVMIFTSLRAQDYNPETIDKPAVENVGVDPNTGMVNRPANPENRGDSTLTYPETQEIETTVPPRAKNYKDSISTPSQKPHKNNKGKKQSKASNSEVDTNYPLGQGGLGTNASSNTVNTNTGMPSNAKTPEEAE